eukprot:TRINITY_DN310_c0_g1_i4.p1 TRINITY_DN310_c0_g1~~TRINITY_DN310_c0_g1_i4.p1  ORF type:complete len:447 (+),score=144.67 TRINITY_DN310_c0_g1_i4:424-1764(+)
MEAASKDLEEAEAGVVIAREMADLARLRVAELQDTETSPPPAVDVDVDVDVKAENSALREKLDTSHLPVLSPAEAAVKVKEAHARMEAASKDLEEAEAGVVIAREMADLARLRVAELQDTETSPPPAVDVDVDVDDRQSDSSTSSSDDRPDADEFLSMSKAFGKLRAEHEELKKENQKLQKDLEMIDTSNLKEDPATFKSTPIQANTPSIDECVEFADKVNAMKSVVESTRALDEPDRDAIIAEEMNKLVKLFPSVAIDSIRPVSEEKTLSDSMNAYDRIRAASRNLSIAEANAVIAQELDKLAKERLALANERSQSNYDNRDDSQPSQLTVLNDKNLNIDNESTSVIPTSSLTEDVSEGITFPIINGPEMLTPVSRVDYDALKAENSALLIQQFPSPKRLHPMLVMLMLNYSLLTHRPMIAKKQTSQHLLLIIKRIFLHLLKSKT